MASRQPFLLLYYIAQSSLYPPVADADVVADAADAAEGAIAAAFAMATAAGY